MCFPERNRVDDVKIYYPCWLKLIFRETWEGQLVLGNRFMSVNGHKVVIALWYGAVNFRKALIYWGFSQTENHTFWDWCLIN